MEQLRVWLLLALDRQTLRYAALGYLLPVATLLLYLGTGTSRFGQAWPWLLLLAVLFHLVLTVNAANDRRRLQAAQERARLVAVRLDAERTAYIEEIKQIQSSVARKAVLARTSGLRRDLEDMTAELDRLVGSLTELLIRNQALEHEIKRQEASRYRASEATLRELRNLARRQQDVIDRVAREIATMDANITLIIHQYEDGEREDISLRIQEINNSLSLWRQSVQQVYGS